MAVRYVLGKQNGIWTRHRPVAGYRPRKGHRTIAVGNALAFPPAQASTMSYPVLVFWFDFELHQTLATSVDSLTRLWSIWLHFHPIAFHVVDLPVDQHCQ
jgi:hypothetical protein